ncbi:hypothetical protein [Flavobacterium bizetiae]
MFHQKQFIVNKHPKVVPSGTIGWYQRMKSVDKIINSCNNVP